MWEEDDVSDDFGAGHEHDEAVDAEAKAACGWHAVFEGFDEVLVEGFCVGFDLTCEGFALGVGVVLLGVAGAEFFTADDEFEDVNEVGVVGAGFG